MFTVFFTRVVFVCFYTYRFCKVPRFVLRDLEASRHNMHLVYPMLVIFDDKMTVYDDLIMGIISYIQTKYSAVQPTLTIPYTIFFLFFHVDNSRIIKTQVLQWINQKQQLMP